MKAVGSHMRIMAPNSPSSLVPTGLNGGRRTVPSRAAQYAINHGSSDTVGRRTLRTTSRLESAVASSLPVAKRARVTPELNNSEDGLFVAASPARPVHVALTVHVGRSPSRTGIR